MCTCICGRQVVSDEYMYMWTSSGFQMCTCACGRQVVFRYHMWTSSCCQMCTCKRQVIDACFQADSKWIVLCVLLHGSVVLHVYSRDGQELRMNVKVVATYSCLSLLNTRLNMVELFYVPASHYRRSFGVSVVRRYQLGDDQMTTHTPCDHLRLPP